MLNTFRVCGQDIRNENSGEWLTEIILSKSQLLFISSLWLLLELEWEMRIFGVWLNFQIPLISPLNIQLSGTVRKIWKLPNLNSSTHYWMLLSSDSVRQQKTIRNLQFLLRSDLSLYEASTTHLPPPQSKVISLTVLSLKLSNLLLSRLLLLWYFHSGHRDEDFKTFPGETWGLELTFAIFPLSDSFSCENNWFLLSVSFAPTLLLNWIWLEGGNSSSSRQSFV